MNIKKFLASTFAGFLTYYLLGFLIYAVLLKSFFPAHDQSPEMMTAITLGCIFTAILYGFIYNRIGGANSSQSALTNGSIIGCILGLIMHSYFSSCLPTWESMHRIVDVILNGVMGAITSYVIWFVNSKISN